MSEVSTILGAGFDDLHELAGTTISYGVDADLKILEGEANEVAEVLMGGIEENVTGVIVAKKEDFTDAPEVGDTFTLQGTSMRVIQIMRDTVNPLYNIAYNQAD